MNTSKVFGRAVPKHTTRGVFRQGTVRVSVTLYKENGEPVATAVVDTDTDTGISDTGPGNEHRESKLGYLCKMYSSGQLVV
jgi:hypothetical protein